MKNILIIGCGLIGSSLLRAIVDKKIAKKIFICEKSKSNILKIKKLKLPCVITNDFKKIIPNLDLIIFCTPLGEYEKIILKINKYLSSKTIITDVGSSKEKSMELIEKKLKKGIFWTSSHPIAGSEVSGPEHGIKNLFLNKWCILIKQKNTNTKHLGRLSRFWKKIGSKVAIMNSKKHDSIFSMTSHLPHLIAYNLVKTATDFEKQQGYDLIKFSAGGLRDFSRIAASNEIMWRDILFNNQKNISKVIDLFVKNLFSFKKDIQSKNNNSIIKKLADTKKVRKKIIKLKQDIDKPDFGRS
ncbi:prephenate dehydrogenase [Candidatus Pelagibacter ubique]|uniref:Prephenate dehydrogenase n=1 Tax=Pelagibacter ubique TaxID=198252 RepID=A0ABX1T302_PELUQ|nr:prephenate dehydrogenase/arogenate dehydrogenase family protein [Candidatus Pelagibacter ubique]NMN67413.1 prephenate dehydrogenase [Candidatus Pelagibacter ubique]